MGVDQVEYKLNIIGKIIHKSKSTLKEYFIIHKYKNFIESSIKYFGVRLTIILIACIRLPFKLVFTQQSTIKAKIPDSNTYLLLRLFLADLKTFYDIFLDNNYDFDCESAKYIIDAGAHIGLSAVFFACKYPEAKILSIEPEDSNYEMLVSNTKHFPNIKTIKAALWSHRTLVNIANPKAASWAFQMSETADKNEIIAINVEEAMFELDTDYIDILKMDIEGSEIEVFQSSGSWIDRVKFIILELHDKHYPGCTQAMENAIQGRNILRQTHGDNTLLTQQNHNL